ncbi:hypothetical protein FB451DRAFT_1516727 [Mycena latifolia]|nr:hypothetical protein FB451DRAFT_1516727 [Mycena latifolia]
MMSELALRAIPEFFVIASSFKHDSHDFMDNFDDFVDGAGGKGSLAALLTQLVDYLLASDNTPHGTARNLCGVLCFTMASKDDAWISALLSRDFLRAAVSILLFVDSSAEVAANMDMYTDLYQRAWNEFWRLVLHEPGYARIAEAIEAGVLTLIILNGAKHIDWAVGGMKTLITKVLLPATLYYPVLALLEDRLPRLDDPASTHAFISSALYPNWQEFTRVALDRLAVKRRFDSGEHVACKACDNMECSRILKKTDVKRCAGCEYQHYCSKECQVKDWRAGHRRECRIIRPPSKSYSNHDWHLDYLDGPAYCTSRDRAFLRALVARDYERQRQHLFLSRIVGMREHGPRLLTLFDYSAGPAQIEVIADSNHEADCSVRAARSSGRMQINCVVLARDVGYWVLPTRSNDSRIHATLVALAQSVPPGTDVSGLPPHVLQTVTKLIEEVCPDVVEIV